SKSSRAPSPSPPWQLSAGTGGHRTNLGPGRIPHLGAAGPGRPGMSKVIWPCNSNDGEEVAPCGSWPSAARSSSALPWSSSCGSRRRERHGAEHDLPCSGLRSGGRPCRERPHALQLAPCFAFAPSEGMIGAVALRRPLMNARMVIWVSSSVLLFAPGAGGGPVKPPEVPVTRPLSQIVSDTEDFVDRTASVTQVEIRARVTGFLQKVLFNEGADVQKGQVLFEIDPAPYRANLQKAQARLALAKAQFQRRDTHDKRPRDPI